ncbi:MAG: MlaD family protein [Bacteroidales bacterium]|nr:MlaD family protein [Bacteroidales bacterium]MDD3131379.1 MlaD family protein [Bacteroidales bacterium]MDD3526003.1 MlaD family protein [Bacteroidales bacterium]MDD4741434.1 MlaD family protein [Bacteroidales bacterium]NCU35583.1 MCE family protein [Candidatus Falkowbacteria bacterium]
MSSPAFKVRLGLFVAGGFILLILAIFLIGRQKNLFNPVFKLTTTFYNVSGLQVGNNVRFSGINIGTVENIKIINDSTIQVGIIVKEDVQQFIKTDCVAAIGSEGIIGDRILIIMQGSSNAPSVIDGQKLLSSEPVEMDAIVASLQISAINAEVVTKQLAEIMIDVNQGKGTVGRLIQDSTIAENISDIIINFKDMSTGAEEKLAIILNSLNTNIDSIMASLNLTAANTEMTSGQMSAIMTEINEGDGTLGLLVRDTAMSGDLSQTFENLKESSKSLNENLEALKSSFLLRGYFKRQEKKKRKAEKKLLELNQEIPADSINEDKK